MGVYLPIITNIVIALVLLTGVFVGIKNGWKIELSKLLLTIGGLVGCYFLQPIVTTWVSGFEFLAKVPETILSCSVYSILFILVYLIISLILSIIKKATSTKEIQGINGAKRVKVKGFDKKTTKKLRKEDKKFRKLNREVKQLRKVSRVFGAFLGFIIALFVGFALMLPTKAVFNRISETQPELEEINKGYDYTIYGIIDGSDYIIKK
jgi:hypothetical protein